MTRTAGRGRQTRSLKVWIPAAVLAAVVLIFVVRGCMGLHDNAIGQEDDKLAGTFAQQHGTGTKQQTGTKQEVPGSGQKGNPNGGDEGEGTINVNNPKVNSPNNGGVNLVGTDSTPRPTVRPTASPLSSPAASPMPTPEPTSNGHELDDKMVIAIDAGHGGYDGGSVVGSVIEKDVNLAVAKEIARFLEEHGGITVVQTRDSDVHVGLQERCDIGNEAKCDYFVSVHCNTYKEDSSVRGFECHYNEKSSEGADFAQSVTDDMKQYTDMKIRSVKPNDLAVTTHTYCPAILIEMGFLTNSTDRANLADPEYQKQLAERIAKAVIKAAGL